MTPRRCLRRSPSGRCRRHRGSAAGRAVARRRTRRRCPCRVVARAGDRHGDPRRVKVGGRGDRERLTAGTRGRARCPDGAGADDAGGHRQTMIVSSRTRVARGVTRRWERTGTSVGWTSGGEDAVEGALAFTQQRAGDLGRERLGAGSGISQHKRHDTASLRSDAGPSRHPTIHRIAVASCWPRSAMGVRCPGTAWQPRPPVPVPPRRAPLTCRIPNPLPMAAERADGHCSRVPGPGRDGDRRAGRRGRPDRRHGRPSGPYPSGTQTVTVSGRGFDALARTAAPASTCSSVRSRRHPATTWTRASTAPSSGSTWAAWTRRPPRRWPPMAPSARPSTSRPASRLRPARSTAPSLPAPSSPSRAHGVPGPKPGHLHAGAIRRGLVMRSHPCSPRP